MGKMSQKFFSGGAAAGAGKAMEKVKKSMQKTMENQQKERGLGPLGGPRVEI